MPPRFDAIQYSFAYDARDPLCGYDSLLDSAQAVSFLFK